MNIIGAYHKIKFKLKVYLPLVFRVLLPHRPVHESDKILLVEGGHIGDGIMDASAWKVLTDHYVGLGKKVFLLASRDVWGLLSRILDADKITYVENDRGGIDHIFSTKTMRSALQAMGFDVVVSRPHGNLQLFFEVAAMRANHRYTAGLEALQDQVRPFMKVLSSRYESIVTEPMDMNERVALEKLLHNMGLGEYRMRIMPIPQQIEGLNIQHKYITVAVDSQNLNRRWGSEKFIRLIEELLVTRKEDIVLTGGHLAEDEIEEYSRAFAENERVMNMVGTLSLIQWVELLRGAELHIGVDSGSIHVAASVGTVAICLAGVWHGHRVFPYDYENDMPGTRKPICIYRQDVDVDKMECFGCAIKGYGWGNNECRAECALGLPCQCLSAISVDDVLSVIKANSNGENE